MDGGNQSDFLNPLLGACSLSEPTPAQLVQQIIMQTTSPPQPSARKLGPPQVRATHTHTHTHTHNPLWHYRPCHFTWNDADYTIITEQRTPMREPQPETGGMAGGPKRVPVTGQAACHFICGAERHTVYLIYINFWYYITPGPLPMLPAELLVGGLYSNEEKVAAQHCAITPLACNERCPPPHP